MRWQRRIRVNTGTESAGQKPDPSQGSGFFGQFIDNVLLSFFRRFHIGLPALIEPHFCIKLQKRHGALGGLQHWDVVAVFAQSIYHLGVDADDARCSP